jgi:hypothetical protein
MEESGELTTVLALFAAGLALGAALLALRVLWRRWRELMGPASGAASDPARRDRSAASIAADGAASSLVAATPRPSSVRSSAWPRDGDLRAQRTAEWLETTPAAHPALSDWSPWGTVTQPPASSQWLSGAFGSAGPDSSAPGGTHAADRGAR